MIVLTVVLGAVVLYLALSLGLALLLGRAIRLADEDAEARRQSRQNHPTNARNRDLVTV